MSSPDKKKLNIWDRIKKSESDPNFLVSLPKFKPIEFMVDPGKESFEQLDKLTIMSLETNRLKDMAKKITLELERRGVI